MGRVRRRGKVDFPAWATRKLGPVHRIDAIVTSPAAGELRTAPHGARTKLKWAHVYELAEPYHANTRRLSGVAARQQNQINDGLGLGTVDIVYKGAPFAGSIHKPLAITGAPFILHDFNRRNAHHDHAKACENKTRHKIVVMVSELPWLSSLL